ncbi:MAG TPA: SufE family protein [Chitinophagales bacterium]|nr:SufE family protein [Chitinophagales bacterium]
MKINELQDQVIEDFEMLEDWADKYEYLIDYGKSLSSMDDAHKTNDNLIKGCQSRVWLHAYMEDDLLKFQADSDAIITKGIVGLLVKILSGHTPKEVFDADLYFLEKIGLQEHLSPTRANGLVSMIKQIKIYAVAYNSLQS